MKPVFIWPEPEKQTVAIIKIEDTPWEIRVRAFADIRKNDGIPMACPTITIELFFGESKNSNHSWTLEAKALGDSIWHENSKKIINMIHATMDTVKIPFPLDINLIIFDSMTKARKHAFLAMISGIALAMIDKISYEEAVSAWGYAEVLSIIER